VRQAVLLLLLTASPAFATSYVSPKRHDVFSRNRQFVLDVNPETKVHTVCNSQDRATSLWSFSCDVWHFPFLLSDDGEVVATVAWEFIWGKDIATSDAVTFWNKSGVFRTHALRDLCPDPRWPRNEEVAPIGEDVRIWYEEVSDDGDGFAIRTTCGLEYRFRYVDGEIVARRQIVARRAFDWRAFFGWVLGISCGLVLACLGAIVWYARRL
jgi:hypothetical protein